VHLTRPLACEARLCLGLAADCELEAISSLVGSGAFKTHNCTVWLGHGGNVTPLHYDLCHVSRKHSDGVPCASPKVAPLAQGLLVQIRGIKRFTYIHPDDSRHVYQRPDRPEVSRVDYCLWKAGASSPEGIRITHLLRMHGATPIMHARASVLNGKGRPLRPRSKHFVVLHVLCSSH